ncbi:hypothetical protein F4815DRAFT_484625 [Daldinia loculata]|nr:hypothetical protein F4815DRAFT_484625 [Daldinia loculata]
MLDFVRRRTGVNNSTCRVVQTQRLLAVGAIELEMRWHRIYCHLVLPRVVRGQTNKMAGSRFGYMMYKFRWPILPMRLSAAELFFFFLVLVRSRPLIFTSSILLCITLVLLKPLSKYFLFIDLLYLSKMRRWA